MKMAVIRFVAFYLFHTADFLHNDCKLIYGDFKLENLMLADRKNTAGKGVLKMLWEKIRSLFPFRKQPFTNLQKIVSSAKVSPKMHLMLSKQTAKHPLVYLYFNFTFVLQWQIDKRIYFYIL